MEKYKQKIGKYGEEVSANYLINKGYNIVARNYRCGYGEIDIIAEDKEYLVFVEVKTRSSKEYGTAAQAVDSVKQKHLTQTALCYLSENIIDKYMRFDVIEVYAKNVDGEFNLEEVNHIENAIQEAGNEVSDF